MQSSLENGGVLVWSFPMQWEPRDGEIRFSSPSNAFGSCPKTVADNGCRPSFSEPSHPSSIAKS